MRFGKLSACGKMGNVPLGKQEGAIMSAAYAPGVPAIDTQCLAQLPIFSAEPLQLNQ